MAAALLAAPFQTTIIRGGIDTLFTMEFWAFFGEAAKTSAGFFWKSGWAFVLGYFISAMIQAFVPKGRLTPYLGGADAKSVGLDRPDRRGSWDYHLSVSADGLIVGYTLQTLNP